ncbi:MAG: DHH family phosphoesterase [Armatimonadota bacterium]|nr:DHH family phosphoesterase [Armatimonadota bacterium]MDR7466571.1 DHH family phosphoesterase [Armatimonadota bacterium]MDR7495107.1 DHH family phosphoesterase [Armatimonadota bacterium]MDR7500181.1 DHH family phosphoesterase [Armatimonadota bacterium]MDR7505645.1 DHH family phosphoesterase [Armatimonadota bacterium]
MPTLPETIAGILRTTPDALIVCHVAPDGDCLGSALALALACGQCGVQALVGSADGVPEVYRFLPGSDRILTAPPERACAVGVAVECSSLDRAGAFAEVLARSRTVINIDHHQSNTAFGDIVFHDPAAAAVGEQISEVIRAMAVPLTRELAQCLLTAIVTDTGRFGFPNTTPRTLRLAADLVAAGGSIPAVVERVYETRTAGGLRLLGASLQRLALAAEGRIAWTAVTPQMLQEAGAGADDVTGIVNLLRQIRGVQVALLFEVTPDGVRVGIRSRDGVRAHAIAEAFGGGGHAGAAGFTASGSLDDVVARTLAAAEKELHAAS